MARLAVLGIVAVFGLAAGAGAARPNSALRCGPGGSPGECRENGPPAASSDGLGETPTRRTPFAIRALPCPPGALPDGRICVRVPWIDPTASPDPAALSTAESEAIPRQADRPASYDAYAYPVPCGDDCAASGYDLERPERGSADWLPARGGAVVLPVRLGTPVTMVHLENQEGDAEVVFAGTLVGATLVTRHVLRERGERREYWLILAHLDPHSLLLSPGAHVKEGDAVGVVGDSGAPGRPHLHLAVRQVKGTLDVAHLAPDNFVVCDPRNVLPLRTKGELLRPGAALTAAPPRKR